MKKLITTIHSKPPAVRAAIAIILALLLTIVIGILWMQSWVTTNREITNSNSPRPLNALIDNIKDVVSESRSENSQNSILQQNTIQIIDGNSVSSTPDALYDESNPASSVQVVQ